ncbi:MAG: NAD-dependent epimerase/dehydratase family protein [Bryobacterales bacterium]|nr:NAD-dependent epimerase/dehydratase family protein [Bryobacterales bacterium]
MRKNASARVLRIAVVGAGYVSRHHIEALRSLPFVELVGIADLNQQAARLAAARYSIPFACQTLAELGEAKPDAIYILTPPETHCPLTLEALEMGCHVFVEKPMAESVAECDRMIEAAVRRGRVLSVNHSDKFDPVVQQALRRVQAGECGEVLAVDIVRSSNYTPYAGGPLPRIYSQGSYPFRDLGVHSLYLLEAFLGPIEELEVKFFSSGNDPDLLFDEWLLQARCAGGLGRAYLSWNARPMQNRIAIYGTRGFIQVDRFLQLCLGSRNLPGPKFVHMVAAALRDAVRTGYKVPLNVVAFAAGRLPPSPGIRAGAIAFARALCHGEPPPVTAAEGRRMVELMEGPAREADQRWIARRTVVLAPRPPVSVLVTGASGFLGRALVGRLLEHGLTVRVLVRRQPAEWRGHDKLQIVAGNLGDPELVQHAVAGVERVFHVGAAMRGGREQFLAGTVWGTRNLVEACLKHRVKRLVHVSSLSVLDHARHRPGMRVTEAWPLEPAPEKRGLYTQTKLEAERIVLQAVREHGLPAVILRPGQIFGPGASSYVPSGAIALAGRWLVCGLGKFHLPLVYVEDVVDALLLAAEADVAPGSIFHIVDPTPLTQSEYLRWCLRSQLRPKAVYHVPRPLFLGLALGVEMLGRLLRRSLPLSRYRVQSLKPLSHVDCAAARAALGWQPRVGVREGMRLTFGGP